MTAQIIQFRDYQSKKDLEQMKADLERRAVEIASMAFPSVFGFVDLTDRYHAPEKDPA